MFASKRKPLIVGKPHQPMLDCIEAVQPFDKSRCVICCCSRPPALTHPSRSALFVGDRLDTDIAFAQHGGIKTLMVLTGISTKAEIDAEGAEIVPDFLMQSIGDLAQL